MVGTAQSFVDRNTPLEVGAPMGAPLLDEAKLALAVLKQREGNAEQLHRLEQVVVQLAAGGDGVPVASEEVSHRST